MSERWPADALVRALHGRTVVDAWCDGEGVDDVRLRLDDGSVVTLDATVVDGVVGPIDLGPQGRLVVNIGGSELWPFDDPQNPARILATTEHVRGVAPGISRRVMGGVVD